MASHRGKVTDRNIYAAHELLVSPARAHRALWRVLAGMALVVIVVIALNVALRTGLSTYLPALWQRHFLDAKPDGSTGLAMLIILASFGFLAIGAAFAAIVLHDRPADSLIGPPGRARQQFWRVTLILTAIGTVLLILPPYTLGAEVSRNMALGRWMALLPLSLIALLIQCSAEEILFRGYLQQQLAARFGSPLIWMGVPSVLFGLAHYMPNEAGDNAILIVIWSGVFGLLMADLTARAGSLGPAVAVHMANNIPAILFYAMPDNLSGLALYTLPFSLSDTALIRQWLPVDMAFILVAWLAARLAIRR